MRASCAILLLASAFVFVSGSPTWIGQPQGNRTERSDRIVNGYPAYEGKAPYIVGLFLLTDGSNSAAVGAGTIISNTWVLTAAHCLTTDSVDINYGSNWGWNGQYKHNVRRDNFILHPGFGNSAGHDIGLIRTPYVDFTNVVNKIPLPKFDQQGDRFEGWWCVACGWGGMDNGNLADWLQCIDVQIISNNECAQSYGSVASTDMCTRQSDGRSVCGGDSGGPLVTQDNPMLVGVITFASTSCKNGPSGYTRVTDHLEWIRDNSGVAYC
ncbi:serine protease 1-like [Drosophila subobscura]|uniref:serine protease 1-like n=1 Tax=Drosophila subobscura TaxID=7241 RepID=UPI00155B06CF|nr:serine protease 1-like [Drosophila subobscura]